MAKSQDTFGALQQFNHGGQAYNFYSLIEAGRVIGNIERLPYSLKLALENQLRFEDDTSVRAEDISAIVNWLETASSDHEIAFRPARVLMQDFTGVPAIVDLAAMRDSMANTSHT